MNSIVNTFESPAVIVRTLDEARRVVALAARLACPVILLTQPGAQAWHGPAYLLEMMRQAGAGRAIIDCGGDAGTAMLALRVGWRELHLAADEDANARIAAMVAALGGRFHAALPAALDLEGLPPVDEPVAEWLRAHGSN